MARTRPVVPKARSRRPGPAPPRLPSRLRLPNTSRTQHGPRPLPKTGETERIAARRVRALDLRKAGGSYRAIAAALSVDVATAWDDVQAELGALRSLATAAAEDVRALELERLDQWTVNLQTGARVGDPRCIMALIRIAERRARLLGLDAATKIAGHDGGPLVRGVDLAKLTGAELDALQALVEKATEATP